jgi:lysozyme
MIGVDVSDFQETFDWQAYAAAGHRFAFVKATEGRTFVAATLDGFRRSMADAGLAYRGFYHFARPDTGGGDPDDARAEAAHFVATVGLLQEGEGVMLDYEPQAGLLPPQGHQDWCVAWVDAVEAAFPAITGKVVFYANASLVAFMKTDRLVTRCPLHVAAFGANDGDEHPSSLGLSAFPGRVDRWQAPTLWQYTSRGRAVGFSGEVDLNRFNGDESGLRSIAVN